MLKSTKKDFIGFNTKKSLEKFRTKDVRVRAKRVGDYFRSTGTKLWVKKTHIWVWVNEAYCGLRGVSFVDNKVTVFLFRKEISDGVIDLTLLSIFVTQSYFVFRDWLWIIYELVWNFWKLVFYFRPFEKVYLRDFVGFKNLSTKSVRLKLFFLFLFLNLILYFILGFYPLCFPWNHRVSCRELHYLINHAIVVLASGFLLAIPAILWVHCV